MKQPATLTVSSLLVIGLTSLHFTQDVLHDPAGLDTQGIVILLAILLTMLYGTVELAGRRLGFLIMLLGGLAAASMPFLHSMGPRATRWGFLFIWTMLAMGAVGLFTAILAAKALWRSFRSGNVQPAG